MDWKVANSQKLPTCAQARFVAEASRFSSTRPGCQNYKLKVLHTHIQNSQFLANIHSSIYIMHIQITDCYFALRHHTGDRQLAYIGNTANLVRSEHIRSSGWLSMTGTSALNSLRDWHCVLNPVDTVDRATLTAFSMPCHAQLMPKCFSSGDQVQCGLTQEKDDEIQKIVVICMTMKNND